MAHYLCMDGPLKNQEFDLEPKREGPQRVDLPISTGGTATYRERSYPSESNYPGGLWLENLNP